MTRPYTKQGSDVRQVSCSVPLNIFQIIKKEAETKGFSVYHTIQQVLIKHYETAGTKINKKSTT